MTRPLIGVGLSLTVGEYPERAYVNLAYLRNGLLEVEILGRGVAWLDTGTHESLLQASNFIQAIQDRQGLMVACPEEVAFVMGYIDKAQVAAIARPMGKNGYGQYLLRLVADPHPHASGFLSSAAPPGTS